MSAAAREYLAQLLREIPKDSQIPADTGMQYPSNDPQPTPRQDHED